jgi:hypothetical protein
MAAKDERSTAKPIACRAEAGYNLWLKFGDGLEGTIFVGNLLEIGAFQLWRDVREFEKVSVDPGTASVTWEGGVRLDSDVLRADLESRGFLPPPRPMDTDPAFLRFMIQAVRLAADTLVAHSIVTRPKKLAARKAARARGGRRGSS